MQARRTAIHGLRRTSHSTRSTSAAATSTSGKGHREHDERAGLDRDALRAALQPGPRGPSSGNSGPGVTRLTRMLTSL